MSLADDLLALVGLDLICSLTSIRISATNRSRGEPAGRTRRIDGLRQTHRPGWGVSRCPGGGGGGDYHAIGSAAPTDPSSSSTDSPVDACSPLGGSASSLAAIPGASVPQVGVRQVDPGSIPDDLLNALIDFLAAVRNGLVPIIENRTPVANPQQVSVPEGGTVGPVRFDACDPDGNRMTFAVRERGAPGGPQHGIVTVDQRTASFIYTADPGFVGTDTFSVNVSDDTSLHVHGLAGYLGPFHGHDDVATVTVFVGNTPTDTISGDFSMLTYNIAGLPFPLSSAILPRFFYTKEIGKRLNAYYVANVQEDFAYHQFLIKKSKMPSQTPPEPPTLLWPIGVPFSDGLNTLSSSRCSGWTGRHGMSAHPTTASP